MERLGKQLKAAYGAVPTAVLWLVVVIWTIPTLGLLVSSFRTPETIEEAGWWTTFPEAVEAGFRSDSQADADVQEEFERLSAEAEAVAAARAEREAEAEANAEANPQESEPAECDPDAEFDPGALLSGADECEEEEAGDDTFDPAAALSGGGDDDDFDPASALSGETSSGGLSPTELADATPETFGIERPATSVGESLDRNFSLENYDAVLFGTSGGRDTMITHFWNSLAIVLPATFIPISIAAFAAYAFAWMDFRGKNWLFVGLVSLMALPNQMAFVPLLSLYSRGGSWTIPFTDQTLRLFPELGIANTSAAVWLTHTAFGLPLAIFLLHNYMSALPKDLIEAARIDGADHFTIFRKIILPLSIPALAAFAIFQFLWTWNDLLIASIFLNAGNAEPMTVAVAQLQGMFGQARTLRFAAAFVTMIVPLIVFFSMQKHFVRGLLAGSVKG